MLKMLATAFRSKPIFAGEHYKRMEVAFLLPEDKRNLFGRSVSFPLSSR